MLRPKGCNGQSLSVCGLEAKCVSGTLSQVGALAATAILSFKPADVSSGLKTTADAVCSRTGLLALTYIVEECGLGPMGVNSGALGLRFKVVDSVVGGDAVVASQLSSSSLVNPL